MDKDFVIKLRNDQMGINLIDEKTVIYETIRKTGEVVSVQHVGFSSLNVFKPTAMNTGDQKIIQTNSIIDHNHDVKGVCELFYNHGYLTLKDEELLHVLILLMQEQNNFTRPNIYISRYGLCKKLGWPLNSISYKEILMGLTRLINTSIKSNYWPEMNNDGSEIVNIGEINFSIIGGHTLTQNAESNEKDKEAVISFTEPFFNLCKKNNLKKINLTIYLSLKEKYKILFTKLDIQYVWHNNSKCTFTASEIKSILNYKTNNLAKIKEEIKKALDYLHALGIVDKWSENDFIDIKKANSIIDWSLIIRPGELYNLHAEERIPPEWQKNKEFFNVALLASSIGFPKSKIDVYFNYLKEGFIVNSSGNKTPFDINSFKEALEWGVLKKEIEGDAWITNPKKELWRSIRYFIEEGVVNIKHELKKLIELKENKNRNNLINKENKQIIQCINLYLKNITNEEFNILKSNEYSNIRNEINKIKDENKINRSEEECNKLNQFINNELLKNEEKYNEINNKKSSVESVELALKLEKDLTDNDKLKIKKFKEELRLVFKDINKFNMIFKNIKIFFDDNSNPIIFLENEFLKAGAEKYSKNIQEIIKNIWGTSYVIRADKIVCTTTKDQE